jgi:hypothetical protein
MPAGLKSSSGNRFEEALFPTAQIQRGELVLMNPDISAGVVAATTIRTRLVITLLKRGYPETFGNQAVRRAMSKRHHPLEMFGSAPDCGGCGLSRKKRSISFVASGPSGSVYEPAGLPPDQA